jgi:hypothetical protein
MVHDVVGDRATDQLSPVWWKDSDRRPLMVYCDGARMRSHMKDMESHGPVVLPTFKSRCSRSVVQADRQ